MRFAFADAARRNMVPAGIPAVVFGPDWEQFLSPGAFDPVTPEAAEPAMVLYTSGSTGRPKGVVLSHQSHLWAIRSRIPGPRPLDQRLLVAAPLFHMNALGTSKFAMASHASVVLMPQFNARHYVEAIGRFRCTYLTSVPTMLALACRERDLLSSTDLTSVRSIRMDRPL